MAGKSRIKKKDIARIMGDDKFKPGKHPTVAGVTVIGDRNTFPISWLQKREYCEYQIYLEHFKKIRARPTQEMITGSREHHRLEAEFLEEAVESTFEEMLEQSEVAEVYSREFPVLSVEYGIHGLIDEIMMTPDKFIIIDDKPGTKMYASNMLQVFGYCLSFKEMIGKEDKRQIYGALRERGTDNIYWMAPFDNEAENLTVQLVQRVHNLIEGQEEFDSAKNPNKCGRCRFFRFCDRRVI